MLTKFNMPRQIYVSDAVREPTGKVRHQAWQQLDAPVFTRVWREVRDQIKWSLITQIEES